MEWNRAVIFLQKESQLEFFVWDIDPEIFKLGTFGPRYYGLFFAAGFIFGLNIMQWQFRKEGKNVEDLSSLITHVMIGTIVGARLGHCLFYQPDYYLGHPLKILALWEGGLASHGGAIGVIIASWIYTRKHPDQTLLWLTDRMAVPLALAATLIRVGNFFNSEIIGRPTDVPWAVIFSRVDQVPRHPAMLYEAMSYLTLFAILVFVYKKYYQTFIPGQLIGTMFAWIFGSRIMIEIFKENQVAFENGMILNMGQILSIPFVCLGLGLVFGYYQKLLPKALYMAPQVIPPTGTAQETKQKGKAKKKKKKLRK